MDVFLSWFQSNHGTIDVSAMDITEFPAYGRGAVALKDIPEGNTIYTIPRVLTLSTRTSDLPNVLGQEVWKRHKLDQGWVGLILCMMWEEAQGASSKWSEYLASLPTSFDTPMFWSAEDLEELKGTAVVDKIGREDAERDYHEKMIPTLQSRPDIFPPEQLNRYYSLDRYHIMGSRILSRSFHVEKWEGHNDDDIEPSGANTSGHSGMDVDEDSIPPPEGEEGQQGSPEGQDGDEEDVEDPSDVAMVPMADILNARYGSENAKLFYERDDLRMVATKPIKAGEQIWNTYGNPPNSDLLRRYGHVDLVPLPEGGEGNPADIVEVRADLVVEVISQSEMTLSPEFNQARIDWWLEEGGDDVFVLESDLELPVPETLISLVRLLLLPEGEWEKARDKGKPPKPKIDAQVLSIMIGILRKRLDNYSTTIQVDERMLTDLVGSLSLNKKNAIIVRLGEKRILRGSLDRLEAMEQLLRLDEEKDKNVGKKRKRGEDARGPPRTQKSRR